VKNCTERIEESDWTFFIELQRWRDGPEVDGEVMDVAMWDLGGQECFYPLTHQLFDRRVVYVVVFGVDSMLDERERIEAVMVRFKLAVGICGRLCGRRWRNRGRLLKELCEEVLDRLLELMVVVRKYVEWKRKRGWVVKLMLSHSGTQK